MDKMRRIKNNQMKCLIRKSHMTEVLNNVRPDLQYTSIAQDMFFGSVVSKYGQRVLLVKPEHF